MTGAPPARASVDVYLERVLAVLRELALEVGGPRAFHAVSPTASLEREIGLGSFERVELLLRLERALDRELDDRFLAMETPAEIAQVLLETGGAAPLRVLDRANVVGAASSAPEDVATIHEALRRRALADCDRPHIYLHEPDGRVEEISYGRLWAAAAAIAGGLCERGVEPGDTVALMLPTGVDFLRSFQGILIARAVPVPLYPPVRLDRLEEYLLRQAAILSNAGARYLITVPQAMPVAHVLRKAVPSLRELTTADELAGLGRPASGAAGTSDDPALIQYTSGSTGNPRGVLLTHANLLANIRAIAAGVELKPTDVGASWLPLYHDMGLIGTWLFCIYHGIPLALLSPFSFLARPEQWLWAIHHRRATLSAAPNFAYELCVRKISDAALEGLDLSSWRCALNGSEPVSPDTLDRFVRRFERYGFRREAFMPVYGLAECSVALCVPPVGRGPLIDRVARLPCEREGRAEPAATQDRSALQFLSVGAPLPRHEVRVIDDTGLEVPERTLGHLVFRGPSAMSGYFRSPDATAAAKRPDGWLESGDLAYQSGGEIYIAGREKDLIIKGGRNYIPQEIEEVAGSVEGIRKGCVAAFGVADPSLGTEALVVVAETRATDAEETSRLEGAVIAAYRGRGGYPPGSRGTRSGGLGAENLERETPPRGRRRSSTSRDGSAGRRRLTLRQHLALWRGAAVAVTWPWLVRARRALYLTYLGTAFVFVLAPLALTIWALVAVLPGRRAAFALGRRGARLMLRVRRVCGVSRGVREPSRQRPLHPGLESHLLHRHLGPRWRCSPWTLCSWRSEKCGHGRWPVLSCARSVIPPSIAGM